jgi:hypothetical protein
MTRDRRKHHRFEVAIPTRFNLNPDHHFVPGIRKMGVGGTVHNVSPEGLRIDSRLDLLDLIQIFPEARDDDATFELEATLPTAKEERTLIRGTVIWYRLSEPEKKVRQFRMGLYLKDADSRALIGSILESIRAAASDKMQGREDSAQGT